MPAAVWHTTGQPAQLSEDLAEQALAFVRIQLSTQSRIGRFGPAQPVADNAPAIDQLVDFFGRPVKVTQAKERLRGKQPKLNSRQEAHLVGLYRTGEHTTGELTDLFSVGRSTVYRAIDRDDRRVHG